jgi:hypothetical protein
MNLDHCMYVFHASLLINCYQRFKISQEVCSWCGMPILWEVGYVTISMMSEIIDYLHRRFQKTSDRESSVKGEGKGEGGGPSEPSSPSSSSSSSSSTNGASENSCHKKNPSKKYSFSHSYDFPLLKLDVKFEFPSYDEELNENKLDNCIKQIEVY